MRDIIAHGYGTLDYDKVWETAIFRIHELKGYIESIMDEFENNQLVK